MELIMKRFALLNAVCLMVVLSLVGCGGEDKPNVPESADGAMNYVLQQLSEGKPVAVWDAMPASYQSDAQGLVHIAAEKMDPEVYDRAMATVKKAAKVMKDQKQYFLGSPMFAGNPDAAEMDKNWDVIVGMLNTVATSEISTLDGLKKMDVRKFLAGDGKKVMAGLEALPNNPLGELAEAKAEITETMDNGDVMLQVTMADGSKESDQFTQVEGRWIPKDIAEGWADEIAEAKAGMETITPEDIARQKEQAMPMLDMIDEALEKLAAAESQQEFDQAFQQVGMMIMMLGAMGGGGI